MATGLGISPNEAEEMYLDRAEELFEFWEEFPPPHVLVRGAVGYKPPRRASVGAPRDVEAIARRFGGEVVTGGAE